MTVLLSSVKGVLQNSLRLKTSLSLPADIIQFTWSQVSSSFPKKFSSKRFALFIQRMWLKQTLKTWLGLNEGYFPLKIVSWLFHGRPVTSLCTCASVTSWVSSSVSKCWPFNSILACGLSYTEANLASGAGGEQRSSRSEPKKTLHAGLAHDGFLASSSGCFHWMCYLSCLRTLQ